MKRFFSGFLALLFTSSISISVFALPKTSGQNTDQPVAEQNSKAGSIPPVLSPPIWMPDNILIDNENLPTPITSIMGSEADMGYSETYLDGQKFTNLLDGYSLFLPTGMSIDLSIADTCTIIKSPSATLKVFKETFSTHDERLSYLVYSNKFTENTKNHTIEKQENYTVGNREYYILQWSRPALKRVTDDQNYYLCVDVCEGSRVYTFFFSSSLPIADDAVYMNIVNSLTTFDPQIPSVNAYNRGYKKSDLSHLSTFTRQTYDKLFSEDSSFRMGIFTPQMWGGYPKIDAIEDYIGYDFSLILEYTEVRDSVGMSPAEYTANLSNYIYKVSLYFDYARSNNKAIELTLQSPLQRNTDSNMVYDILNGEFDRFFNEYTKLISSYPDVTVLFRPFNEMNGDWCNYSSYHTSRDPEIYVELYKYIYKKFQEAGCSNVIWVWNPNEKSFPNYKWNSQSLYYPGDEYVDVYGITGYNTGTYYQHETWRSFDEIYAPIYYSAIKLNEKPMMITEFSCSAIGGDKVAWIEDMFKSLPKYDKIKLGVWWNASDFNGEELSRPYFIDTPDGTLDIFKKYLGKER